MLPLIWVASAAAGLLTYRAVKKKLSAPQLLPNEVPAVRTTLTPAAARGYLRLALKGELKRAPSDHELAMVAAQSALETRNWQAMWNWNYGNVTAIGSNPWFTLHSEASAHRYKPYTDAMDGARHFVAFLHRVYPEAWSLIGTGDTAAFAAALKRRGYFEGDLAGYARGLDDRYALA